MNITEFNGLVNRMRNKVQGRSVVPVVTNKKVVADVLRFVRDWRVWWTGPHLMDPFKDTSHFLDRYTALRARIRKAKTTTGKSIKLAAAPRKITTYDFPEPLKAAAWNLSKAFAWGLGLVAGVYVLGAVVGRRRSYGE